MERIHADNGWAPPVDSSAPGGALWRLLEAGFTDASASAGPTSPADEPLRRIDYVLAAKELGARAIAATTVPGATGSDHLPVVVDLSIPDGAPS